MKTKIRIIRLSDDQLNDVNGGIIYCPPSKASLINKLQKTPLAYKKPAMIKKMSFRGNKKFTKGNLIGFCEDCHVFVYEYNLSLHQNHNVICAGGR